MTGTSTLLFHLMIHKTVQRPRIWTDESCRLREKCYQDSVIVNPQRLGVAFLDHNDRYGDWSQVRKLDGANG